MIVSLPSLKVPLFFISLCYNLLGVKKSLGFRFNVRCPMSIPPLLIWESTPPPLRGRGGGGAVSFNIRLLF